MSAFFEIGATLFGLAQGVLVMLNKRANWVFYTLQMLFLIVFSLISNLYGDLVGNSVYFAVGIVGFVTWGRADGRKIGECRGQERLVYSALMLLLTAALFLTLNKTNDPLPLIDAFTTVSGAFATYYMLTKKLDAWILWFINDVVYIVEYYLLPERAWYLLSLNVVWTAMAVASFIEWRKIMKRERKNEENIFCGQVQA